jgi:peptidoglycan hydrolase CwlO-like protein
LSKRNKVGEEESRALQITMLVVFTLVHGIFSLIDLASKCASLESTLAAKESELTTLKSENSGHRDEAAKMRREADAVNAKLGQVESRLKELQSEFECQRHNAEATKVSLEKKLKEQVIFKTFIYRKLSLLNNISMCRREK